MKLYYLTSLPFADFQSGTESNKNSRISELNDSCELKSANLNEPCNKHVSETFNHQTNKSHGLICFSSSWINPGSQKQSEYRNVIRQTGKS
jgi:phenolic acid decarboxylase